MVLLTRQFGLRSFVKRNVDGMVVEAAVRLLDDAEPEVAISAGVTCMLWRELRNRRSAITIGTKLHGQRRRRRLLLHLAPQRHAGASRRESVIPTRPVGTGRVGEVGGTLKRSLSFTLTPSHLERSVRRLDEKAPAALPPREEYYAQPDLDVRGARSDPPRGW
jgi:hypothetical protein